MAKSYSAEPRWLEDKQIWKLEVSRNGQRPAFFSKNPSRVGAAECRRQADEWLESLENLDDIDLKSVRIKQAFKSFSDEYRMKNKETSYLKLLDRYKAHIKAYDLKIVSKMKKSNWQNIIYDAYHGGAKSKSTLKGIATTIRTFCKWCAAKGIIKDDQVPIYFDYPIGAADGEKGILQPYQLQRLLTDEDDAEEFPYMYCFRFIALVGLRRGEFCALQTFRDFDGKRIIVRESISHDQIMTDGKTTNAKREIVLSPLALEQIRLHQSKYGVGKYLFQHYQESGIITPRALGNHWRNYRRKYNFSLTLQELRHTHISYSRLKTNITLDELKELYGHSKQMDTDRVYVHKIDKTPDEVKAEREKAMKKAEEIGKVFEAVAAFKFDECDTDCDTEDDPNAETTAM